MKEAMSSIGVFLSSSPLRSGAAGRRPHSLLTVSPRSSLHRPSPAGATEPPAEAPLPFSEYLASSDPDKRQRAEN